MIAPEARRRNVVAAVAFGGLVALLELYSWGFTVDDALITARVAENLRSGAGYRFNPGGPIVDAVTPLGYAPLLAVLSRGGPLATMHFAKWFGALAGVCVAAIVGVAVARVSGSRSRYAVLAPLACSLPFGAWSVSGMETGLVTLLATLALVLPVRAATAVAGVAGALRPELVPWCVTLALGTTLAGGAATARSLGSAAALSAGPALVAALVRLVVFGAPAPLAVWAKPSDAAHGAFYAAACLLWTGAPLLVVGWGAVRRLPARSRAVLVACAVHLASLFLAGGDWMPFFRLFVPVLPGLFLVGAELAAEAPLWGTAVRVGAATVVSAVLLIDKGPAARAVGEARERLIAAARPALAGSRSVAALDVGWVGAAYPGTVVDLAGVTDETIAKLPGGHTSKKVTPAMLEHRGVDTLVLLTDGPFPRDAPDARTLAFHRTVEARLGGSEEFRLEVRATLELAGTNQRYVVLHVKNAP